MKQQQLEHQNNLNNSKIKTTILIILLFLGGIISLFTSCENGIEKVKLMSEERNFPDQSMTNAEIHHTTNGRLKVKITAAEINRYISVDEPHTIFPKGLDVLFYDSTMNVESRISANYAIYHESDKKWEARNDVVTINNEGDTLNTEYLVWDQNKEIIHTDQYVRITTPDGIIQGKGFESSQDFSNWRIKETTGTIEVNNE